MKLENKSDDEGGLRFSRLIWVFLGSMISVFGLLLLTMAELEDFSQSAFRYWTPRASIVVVVATALGWLVMDRGIAVRFGFGFLGGLGLALLYLWVT